MKKLYLSFVWHMHQPYYKDDISGISHMPWVFLHLIKDYYEIPWHHKRYGIKATFNLVPSLLKQFQHYSDGFENDRVMGLFLLEIPNLQKEQKELLHRYLFLSSAKQREEFSLYDELFIRYGKKESFDAINEQNLLDLQMLFLLSWCGYYIREDSAFVQDLINQGKNFTQNQKIELLQLLQSYAKNIVNFYKEGVQEGIFELSTTPFYHPIAPLLLDINQAKYAKKDTALPQISSSLSEFAHYQVKEAKEYFNLVFGFYPQGFWPAEGGVSEEALELFATHGIKWCATDEAILAKSKPNFTPKDIYSNYTMEFEKNSIDIRFRDRSLSDAIGFNYSHMDAKDAVDNFISSLEKIYTQSTDSTLVNVILDGENAWEFYRNNAYDFFTLLFEKLAQLKQIQCVQMQEVQNLPIQTNPLKKLQSGSWIDGDFHIWVGHKEKNRAWELIDKTYKECYRNQKLDLATNEKIFYELNIAMGSDWFWWYGDDHYTQIKDEFDALFRTHLINCYDLANREVPYELFDPIIAKESEDGVFKQPKDCYSIDIEKKITAFDFAMSAKVDLKKRMQAMDRKLYIDSFYYLFDEKGFYLFFKLDLSMQKMHLDLSIDGQSCIISFDKPKQSFDNFQIVVDEYLKIRYNFCNRSKVAVSFALYEENQKIESFGYSQKFYIDKKQFLLEHWFV